ncbi:polysaccharide deacetylase family protein [Nocardioides dongxiaopingii]|uniref:polysaccharide deacetylase family protein n=1 Tax=Nocardioides sp. S-1144 TaxID=2582905 RepID=UPI00110EA9EC|nr:polysaccharide deacetylase family protein [Nocardioides sp. S-1144]QCW52051.1 polysaccharide deacetylase family protein [Nocardioides sp. S-1144]
MAPASRTLPALRATLAATLVAAVAAAVLTMLGAPASGSLSVDPPAPAPSAPAPSTRPLDRCPSGRVALTFDDGPSPTTTPAIVAVLRRMHVPATFFMVGSRVRQHPDVAREVAEAGFTIGNHTDDHVDLTGLSRTAIRTTLRRTERALRDAGVADVSRYVRPPYGATDAKVAGVLRATGRVMALWNVDSRDWEGLTPREIRSTTIDQVTARGRAGIVVLHHDGVATSEATLAALPSEIRRLREAGYCLTPLPAGGLD